MTAAALRTVCFVLGFALVTADMPWAYADYNVGRWAVAWIGVAILLWFCPDQRIVWSGVAFLALAVLSLLWAPVTLNAIGALLHLILLAGVFVVGAGGFGEDIFLGAAGGMAISSAICVWQWLFPDHVADPLGPSGLFFNRDFLAETALLVAIPFVWSQRWWIVAALSPAILLPRDRAVFVAIGAVAILALWRFSRAAAIGAAVAASIAVVVVTGIQFGKSHTIADRVALWQDAAAGLTPLGRGIGQFYNTYPEHQTHQPMTVRPDHAHNDWLEIAYELGPAGLGAALWFGWDAVAGRTARRIDAWGRRGAILPESAVFLAFAVLALFSFPLHNAASSVLGVLAAGGVQRSRLDLRRLVALEPAYAVSGGAFGSPRAFDCGCCSDVAIRSDLSAGVGRVAVGAADQSDRRDRRSYRIFAQRSAFG